MLKLEFFITRMELKKDLAAMCSIASALLITLSTVGDFQRKWHANRIVATAMENLVLEVMKKGPADDLRDIYSRMQQVNVLRNSGIVGSESVSTSERELLGEDAKR